MIGRRWVLLLGYKFFTRQASGRVVTAGTIPATRAWGIYLGPQGFDLGVP